MASTTLDFFMSSLDLLDGVNYTLGPWVCLVTKGTALGAPLKLLAPDANGFLGHFFLFTSMTTLLNLEIFTTRAVNFLVVQYWLRVYL